MLEEFRELVRAGILRVTPENEVLPVRPVSGSPESDTPASREQDVALLDKQLMEWLERRRAQKSAEARRRAEAQSAEPEMEGLSSDIRRKVIERVAQKILEGWDKADQESGPHESLREQIIERVSSDILRRWQRNPE
jgi:hypothetical protein